MNFSPQERYLLKNQKAFVLNSDDSSSDSDSGDFDPNDETLLLSPFALKFA